MKNIQILNARWNPYVYLVISDYSLLRTTTPVLEHDICLIRHRLVRKSGDMNCHSLLCDVTTHAASLLSLTLSSAPWQHIPFYFVFIHLETSVFLQDRSKGVTTVLCIALWGEYKWPLLVQSSFFKKNLIGFLSLVTQGFKHKVCPKTVNSESK